MKNIAIFASGNGTNAQRIAEYFAESSLVNISLILTNNPEAGVLQRAEKLGITSIVFNRESFSGTDNILEILKIKKIDFIVLAGFLWLIPHNIINSFPNRIVNIHPALLPKYGGKGMYGHHVHDAVILSGDEKSGITIHYVNEKYDEGNIIFQAKTEVTNVDTPDSLAGKIHKLEYAFFPKVIEDLLRGLD